ncbi:DUF4272 domain-containing protein [Ralstonia pseudosolanacearum]|uniref:DUF4272 domain-containing protein n=1 Tax=Ralstonia pseudosolanacearum TaxID=1310165 RepID=UPI001FF9EB16|nr:DUF4272 domain-containing protein [Ralstonia pseudosolanacearum]
MQFDFEEVLSQDEIREAPAIAKRALALFAVVGLALGVTKDETVAWLRDESLWEELSPQELMFVSGSAPTERQFINASWRSEALLILLWALGLVEALPGLAEQCDTGNIRQVFPPFADVSVKEFVSKAQRRSDRELLDMADILLNAHWMARDACIHNQPMPSNLDIGIIQQRHHAINWVIGYEGLAWDEVTTDT